MRILTMILIVAGVGALGGLVNCFLSGEFALPHIDRGKNVWRPGWPGNILIGAVAAVAVWCLYGPAATYDLASKAPVDFRLPIAQLAGSMLVGISGATILTTFAQKEAERHAKLDLAATLDDFLKKK